MRILRRLEGSGEQGLVEVMAVFILFGALLAVAVPVYMGFQDRRAEKAAKANLLAATQVAEVYRARHGSYAGMDALELVRIDPRVSPTLSVASARRGKYCLTDNVRGKTWSLAGPAGKGARFSANSSCA